MEINRQNMLKYADLYDKRYQGTSANLVEKEIKNLLSEQKYLTRDNFIKIGLWKSKRATKHYKSNDDRFVQEITKFSFSTKNEEAKIKSLMVLDGVSFPVASTILHFAFPNDYSIMDFRALWSLGWEQPKSYDFNFWQKYSTEIKKISEELELPFRTIDKALWQYSKDNQTD